MKRLIFLKTFGSSLLIIVLLAVVILVTAFGAVRHRYLDSLAADLEKLARALEPDVNADIDRAAWTELETYFQKFEKQTQIRLTLILLDGKVMADSEQDPARMENHRYRPEVIQALEGRTGRALRFSDTLGVEMLYIALPILHQGQVVGCLRVSSFSREINAVLSGLKRSMTETAAVVTALALVLAFFISRSYTRPIGRMIEVSQKIASGDFTAKVYVPNRDELGRLASSLNAMNERIRGLFIELTTQKEEIQGIIGSMEEGLLVVEPDEKISLANPSFRRIFPVTTPEGKYYWEAVRNTRFNALVQKARGEKRTQLDRITIQNRTYLAHASYIPATEHIAVTLHDVTDILSIERVKRDLVANVSHELQTPLTAIKGYAETLESEAKDKDREYLKIILRNTDRLIAIVRDLLQLSELEDVQEGILTQASAPVDLKALLENALKIFEPKARDKGLAMRFEAGRGPVTIKGDAFKLEQMAINLIDNAVKYTERGGLTIRLAAEGKEAVLQVEDTGIGIDPEHLPRIFERFYVVDKSRSKNLGGTGLGLSIVKHIVQMHKGQVSVDSRLGRGTIFTVRLPLAEDAEPETTPAA